MEDQQAAFLNMLMDRLHALEQQGAEQARAFAELSAKVSSVLPAVLPPPYKRFEDGYELVWKLGDVPLMRNPGTKDLLPLDARHAAAFLYESSGGAFTVGREVPRDAEEDSDEEEADPENPDGLVWRAFNAVFPWGEVTLGQFIMYINTRISNRYSGLAVSDWELEIVGGQPRNFP
ncbi:hypothetical protein ABBQ32_011334 [Trebouxia sp. C0010 RCD-2024]